MFSSTLGTIVLSVSLAITTPLLLPCIGASFAQGIGDNQTPKLQGSDLSLNDSLSAFKKIHKLDDQELKRLLKTVERVATVLEKLSTFNAAGKANDRKLNALNKQLDRAIETFNKQLAQSEVSLSKNDELKLIVLQVHEITKLYQTADMVKKTTTQKVSKREQQALSRVDGQLDRIAKKIERFKWSNVRNDGGISRIEKDLAKALAAFEAVPDAVQGHAATTLKVSKITSLIAEMRKRVEGLLSETAGVKNNLAAHMRSGQLAQDNKFLQDATTLAYEQLRAADNGILRFWNARVDAQKYAKWAATIDDIYARAKEIQNRYGGVTRRDLEEVARQLGSEIGDLSTQRGAIGSMLSAKPEEQLASIFQVHAMLTALRHDGPALVHQTMQKALSAAKPLENALDYDALTKSEEIAGAIIYAEDVLTVVAGFPNGSDAAQPIQKEYDAGKAQIDAVILRVYDKIVEGNYPPRHNYTGNDTALLLKLAQDAFAAFHKEQSIIGGIIESTDWYRETKEEIQNGTLVKIDQSSVRAYIFAVEPGNRVSQWAVEVTKNHRQNDTLSTHLWQRTRPQPLPPHWLSQADKLVVFE